MNIELRPLSTFTQDEYDGYFKKGIPHGLGKYTWHNGDVYEGNFKNGLQSGYGKYTWANGDVYEGAWLLGVKNGNGKIVTSKGITQTGKWYKDIYTGDAQATEAPYKILSKRNVRTIRISEKTNSATNNIEIVFKREGRTYHEMENLSLIGSSGTIINSSSYTAYESFIAPFKGKIMFTAPDDFYRSTYQCEFTFEITKQGSWLIEIVF